MIGVDVEALRSVSSARMDNSDDSRISQLVKDRLLAYSKQVLGVFLFLDICITKSSIRLLYVRERSQLLFLSKFMSFYRNILK